MPNQALVQAAYTTILRHYIQTGEPPHFTKLADALGVLPDEAREAQREAADAAPGCWLLGETDYVESWAPFYSAPTPYTISVAGKKLGYAQ